MVRLERVSPPAILRTVHTASRPAAGPRIESKRWTSIVTRYDGLKLASGAAATFGVPRITTRFAATTRAIESLSGATHRLNSSTSTRFGATCTTNSGRSTAAGIVTGPIITLPCAGDEDAPSAVAVDSSV